MWISNLTSLFEFTFVDMHARLGRNILESINQVNLHVQLSKILFLHQQHNSQRKLKSFSTVGSVLNEQLEHKRRRGRTKRLSTAGIQYLKVISLGRVAVNKPFLRKEERGEVYQIAQQLD